MVGHTIIKLRQPRVSRYNKLAFNGYAFDEGLCLLLSSVDLLDSFTSTERDVEQSLLREQIQSEL